MLIRGNPEVVIIGCRWIHSRLNRGITWGANRRRSQTLKRICVIWVACHRAEVFCSSFPTQGISKGSVTLQIHIIVQAVVEDRCNLRTVIIGQGFSLNNRCHDNDLLVSKIQVVTLIKRNASGIQVKISCLCLKLIKHGTDDRIGSYIAFCKGIGLGEQVALKRIISIYRTSKERIVSNIIGCFCLIQEIIARNTKVVLNQIRNLRNGITFWYDKATTRSIRARNKQVNDVCWLGTSGNNIDTALDFLLSILTLYLI